MSEAETITAVCKAVGLSRALGEAWVAAFRRVALEGSPSADDGAAVVAGRIMAAVGYDGLVDVCGRIDRAMAAGAIACDGLNAPRRRRRSPAPRVAAERGAGRPGRPVGRAEAVRRFRWTLKRRVTLTGLYLDAGLGATAIARRMGEGATREIVQVKIVAMGLAAQRGEPDRHARRLDALELARVALVRSHAARGHAVWTADRVARLRRLYLDQDVPPAMIARDMGLAVLAVRRRIKADGLAGMRRAMGKPRLRARNLVDIPGLEPVTRCPDGVARGVSAIEIATGWTPAPASIHPARVAGSIKGAARAARVRELNLTADRLARQLAAPAARKVLA